MARLANEPATVLDMRRVANPLGGVQVAVRVHRQISSDSQSTPNIFGVFNSAIAAADRDGDARLVDLLLAGKMAVVRRHHALLAEGR